MASMGKIPDVSRNEVAICPRFKDVPLNSLNEHQNGSLRALFQPIKFII
jgi:hypothetical protein